VDRQIRLCSGEIEDKSMAYNRASYLAIRLGQAEQER
jgi:hypothetical protein